MLKYYNPNGGFSKHLKSFNTFDDELDRMNKSRTFTIDLQYRFEALGYTHITDQNIFGYSYDNTLNFSNHASERIMEFKDIVNKYDEIVVDGDPGIGKTTLIGEVMVQLYKVGKTPCYCAPKNIINEQIYRIIKTKYPEINIFRNYCDQNGSFLGADDKSNHHYLYISSYASLEKLEYAGLSVLCMDEVQDLINYSGLHGAKQIKFPPTKKSIFFSATPEVYMIGQKSDYYSVRFIQDGAKKTKIEVVPTNNVYEYGKNFIGKHVNDNILIYLNDKNKGLRMKDELSQQGINIGLINADTAGSTPNNDVIFNQKLPDGVWVCTDLLNAGVNILNHNWNYIVMLVDMHKDIFKIEQFPKRLRNQTNVTIYLATTFNYPPEANILGDSWENVKSKLPKGKDSSDTKKIIIDAKAKFKQDKIDEVLADPLYGEVHPFIIRKRLDMQYESMKQSALSMCKMHKELYQEMVASGNLSVNSFYTQSLLNDEYIYEDGKNLKINKNQIKLKISNDAMELITNHPALYKMYLCKMFAIRWSKPIHFTTTGQTNTIDIFLQYPNEINQYYQQLKNEKMFFSQYPYMYGHRDNMRENRSKYEKLIRKYSLANEYYMDVNTIYDRKFDDMVMAKVMQSFGDEANKAYGGIQDANKHKLYKNLMEQMYIDYDPLYPMTTQDLFDGLSESSKKTIVNSTRLGIFINKFIVSVDKNWEKHGVKIGKNKEYVWRQKRLNLSTAKVDTKSEKVSIHQPIHLPVSVPKAVESRKLYLIDFKDDPNIFDD